jgi:hypothetical protein
MSRPEKIWLRRIRWLLAVALVVGILYVLIAPWLDLPPSALRAWSAACVVLMCLRLWVYRAAAVSSISLFRLDITGWSHHQLVRGSGRNDLLDLYCARLC